MELKNDKKMITVTFLKEETLDDSLKETKKKVKDFDQKIQTNRETDKYINA